MASVAPQARTCHTLKRERSARPRLHRDWTRSDTAIVRRRSRYERGVWVARHPVRGGLFIGVFYVLWMLLLPSIREPRLLATAFVGCRGGGGNRTPVPGRPFRASPGAAGGKSRLEAPTGGGPLGQPGFDVRPWPPGGAIAVSLLTTPILPSQASGRGRLPSYLGSERVIVIGACVGPGF